MHDDDGHTNAQVPPRTAPEPRSLASLDLNLLVTLDAVIQHQSVTRAAEQLAVSQPAVSAALRRLRRHFGDELLYRAGNRHRLTPLGIDLRPRTRVALQGVERVFNTRAQFDISDTMREFSILISDYATMLMGKALVAAILEQAPHARIRLIPTDPDHVARAEQTLTENDLMLIPHGGFVTDLPTAEIFRDEWVIVMDRDHPAARNGPTAEDLRTLPWVLVFHGTSASTPAARQLRMRGIEPRVQVVTETFMTVPPLVSGSARIALLPVRLLDGIAPDHGLVSWAPPIQLDPLVQAMWWHPIHEHEPEHRFLRDIVLRTAREVCGPGTEIN